jgi:hypothetical protein
MQITTSLTKIQRDVIQEDAFFFLTAIGVLKANDVVQWIAGKISQLWLTNTISPINTLPTEMRQHIFSFLDYTDLGKAALVCNTWSEEIGRLISIDKEKIFRITKMIKTTEIETPAQYKNLVDQFQKIKIFSKEETEQLVIALGNKLYTVIGKDCKISPKLHDRFNDGLIQPVETLSTNLQDIGTIIQTTQLLSLLAKIKQCSPCKEWPSLPPIQNTAIVKNLLAAMYQNNRLISLKTLMTIPLFSDYIKETAIEKSSGLAYPIPEQETTWSQLPLGASFFEEINLSVNMIKEKYNALPNQEKNNIATFLILSKTEQNLCTNPSIVTYKQTLEWIAESDFGTQHPGLKCDLKTLIKHCEGVI